MMAGGVGTGEQRHLDAKAVLRMIYDRYPSPWIGMLLSD